MIGMIVYICSIHHITTDHHMLYTCPRAAPTLPVPSIIPVTDDNASLSPFNAGYTVKIRTVMV